MCTLWTGSVLAGILDEIAKSGVGLEQLQIWSQKLAG
jgi:hypothetical protein